MMRRLSWQRASGVAVGLAAVSLILAGCVNMPSGGAINAKLLPNSVVGNQLVVVPRAPGPLWEPYEIVSGFLVASGANPSDPSIARDYLSQGYVKKWHPSQAPEVIDSGRNVAQTFTAQRVTGGQSSAQVTVTSQHLETLVAAGGNKAGRLQVVRGPAPYLFTFELVKEDGRWRIDSIIGPNGKASDSILLLTASDFERDYLPRNLYYLARRAPYTLVPYPVYIPAQVGQVGGVQQLVDALGSLPPTKSNWLYSAIKTAFPPHARLTAQVNGSNATVSVSGNGATAGADTIKAMEAQLVSTLTYAPDSPGGTGITSVDLQIGHKLITNLVPYKFTSWIPQGPTGPLYYQTLDQAGHPLLEYFRPSPHFGSPKTGKAGEAGSSHGLVGGDSLRVATATGLGRGPFTAVAVSPVPSGGVSSFAGCRGKEAYVAPLVPLAQLETISLPGPCTSLSWDRHGDLWAIVGSDVYVLNAFATGLRVVPVTIPAQQIAQSDKFVSLKVSPDGLRVAMIVRGKHSASVYVSAITKRAHSPIVYLAQGGPVLTLGPDLVNPIALTWWKSDYLLVLERQNRVAQLHVVPVNGGVSTEVPTPPNAISVTANGSFVAVETPGPPGGQPTVLVSHGLEGPWVRAASGSTPTYIG
jgi:hypothetical protein